ncbi:universal stress protein [uncultured Chitinophaga sp.]|uniref:universal stress protein n=1 Tax=uncultured Chitinophaga sp. TaxID=339340 RepID=UPI0025D440B4|nr:universal stress protein [uncultured Chitinophaga sp.]
MKKIAAVIDGLKFSDSTLQYTLSLARHEEAHLTGIFPDDFIYNSFSMYNMITSGASPKQIADLEAADTRKRDEAAEKFVRACQASGFTYSVHRDKSIAIQEVLHESIYADLMIIGMQEDFRREEQPQPTEFIRNLLTDVQCPVLLVPPVYTDIKKVILLYDGEPSSVFAIKMCCYLLPWIKQLPVEILSVNPPGTGLHLGDNRLMREFVKRHFPSVEYRVLNGEAEEKILYQLAPQTPDTLVVAGAYRRGMVSRWFRESMADVLMKNLALPLFIAHNK